MKTVMPKGNDPSMAWQGEPGDPVWGSLYTLLTLSSYVFIFNRENRCKERNGFSRLRAPGSGTEVEGVRQYKREAGSFCPLSDSCTGFTMLRGPFHP